MTHGPDSAAEELRLLLEKITTGKKDPAQAILQYDIARIDEILRPAVKASAVADLPKWTGGIFGSPGAAAGRAYFSSAALLEAKRRARRQGGDGRCVLVLPSAFAGDVPALEAAEGALTVQGGYASHASVIARQHGKVSLVAPELRIAGKTAALGDLRFGEGDFITLDVKAGGSAVYLGAAELTEPETGLSSLLEFIALAGGFLRHFQIRANAETPEAAERALLFGASGIGLCRTEHMFFRDGRLNRFRSLILSESPEEREEALEKLRVMQAEDFYRIFKVMAGKPVAVRLLDAPLHEFMPRGEDELNAYLDYRSESALTPRSREEVLERIEALGESNPMLGRRGCRIAVSYPDIYAMQVRAVFEAACRLRDEHIEVRPEIMIPLTMNAAELRLIAYGKKAEGARYAGIVDLEETFRNETGSSLPPYRIGSMIELPAAALGAGDIARHAEFFSFGANDLTQTTLGLSRDDAAGFLSAYSRYDLLEGNPFSVLDDRVKELIALAVERGRLIRPDLVCGLCGEQGADPAGVRFCLETGLDYVSCSPYAVPGAILAAAQEELSTTLYDR
ncbi:MAG: pyruvate, phosphate dikinase [Treponema sp.]|jgi:pyruvate,orthophosphate dikinase|nr:pyruvate, phosphate dikinase [Treponema sp.]